MPLEFNQDQGNFQKTGLPDPDKIYETMSRRKKKERKKPLNRISVEMRQIRVTFCGIQQISNIQV